MKFNAMFQPINIGPMTVKNRFVVPPMGNNFANTDGSMSEQSAAYYRERAKGGFGLITIEATVVHKGAKGGPRKPCLYDDSTIESFRKVVDACHAEEAKVSVQLQNAGPEGNAKNALFNRSCNLLRYVALVNIHYINTKSICCFVNDFFTLASKYVCGAPD